MNATYAEYANWMSNTTIIPAVLPSTYTELEESLGRLRGVAPLVQVDMVTPLFEGTEVMPYWEEFDFEFDIFLEQPETYIEQCLALGASRIVVHLRHEGARAALERLQQGRDGEFAVAVGVALRSTDTLETLEPYAGLYDYVQVMGIVKEGNQGEPFDERAFGLVAALRAAYPRLDVQVDGGVAPRAEELVRAGANRLVIGSALLRAENPRAAYKELYTKANAH